MKAIKNIWGWAVALLAATTLSSCGNEEADYTPADAVETMQVYFPSSSPDSYVLSSGENSFDITIMRVKTEAAADVPLSVSGTEGLYEFPSSVSFAAGSATSKVTVKYDPNNMEYNHTVNITVSVGGDSYTTPYGIADYTFSAYVTPWNDWELFGTGTYTYVNFWSGEDTGLKCYRRSSLVDPNLYQFRIDNVMNGINLLINYDAETNACSVAEQFIGYVHDSYGNVYCADALTYWRDIKGQGATYEDFPSNFNPELGRFTIYMAYFVPAGTFGYDPEYFQLDGYEQPDYNLQAEYRGHYIDQNNVDNAIIYVNKGADVDLYRTTILKGSYSQDELVDVALKMVEGDESIAFDEYTESSNLLYPLTEGDNYTFLAVAMTKSGEPVNVALTEFEFFPVGQESPWESLGMCEYTDDVVMPLYTENGDVCTYAVEVLEHKEKPGLFRLKNPYGKAFPFYEYAQSYPSSDVLVEIDATDPHAVTIPLQSLGLDLGDGLLGIWCAAAYEMEGGKSKEEVAQAGLFGTYANKTITFPKKALFLVVGNKLYYANTNEAFKVDMTNLQPATAATRAQIRQAAKFARNLTNPTFSLDKKPLNFVKINSTKMDNETYIQQLTPKATR